MSAAADRGRKLASTCPHPDCQQQISRHLFACRTHWFQLSKPVRDAIYATASRGVTRERIDAVKAAMQEWAL
jgi:hypothetical protein